jgi:hypothetical protein
MSAPVSSMKSSARSRCRLRRESAWEGAVSLANARNPTERRLVTTLIGSASGRHRTTAAGGRRAMRLRLPPVVGLKPDRSG